MSAPERVAGLIIQNGDIYEDVLGPKYGWLKEYWANPTPEGRSQMAANVSEEGFRDEFVGELPGHLVERVSPDLWKLHWSLMQHPPRSEIVVGIFEDQANTLADFPRIQAYLRDLPDAELHLLDGGHWALETNLDEVVALVRDFLDREHSGR